MNLNLLNDIVRDDASSGFRARLEAQFLAEARKKRVRRTLTWMAAAASLVLACVLSWPKLPVRVAETPAVASPQETIPMLATRSLSEVEILKTGDSAPILESHSIDRITFATDFTKPMPSISDEELLNLFPHRATGLLASRDGKMFVFLNPADARTFLISN